MQETLSSFKLQELLSPDRRGQVSLDLQGGLIRQLTLGGQKVFWSGTRPDGKQTATHFCIPQFGPYSLPLRPGVEVPQHGTARTSRWEVFSRQPEREQIILHVPGLEKLYPNLYAYASFVIQPQRFFQLLTLDNRSQQPQQLAPGLHWYWNIPLTEAERIRINGVTYSENQWLNSTLLPVARHNSLETPIGNFQVTQKGFQQLVIWSQPEADFVCIELGQNPANLGKSDRTVLPNEMRHTFAAIEKIN